MNLDTWREQNKFTWLNVARQLTLTGNGSIYVNRLNRLRSGSKATEAELKALLELTKNEVDDYRD